MSVEFGHRAAIASYALAACACGSAIPPTESVEGPFTTPGWIRGDGLPPKTLVLTYDDGPDDQTLAIAEYLSQQGIVATFFVNGKRFCKMENGACRARPLTGGCPLTGDQGKNKKLFDESVLAKLQSYGHRIGNHTQDHCNLAQNPRETRFEFDTTQALLDRNLRGGPFVFRPPYAAWTLASEAELTADTCLDKLRGPVAWDVGGGDWSCWQEGIHVDECLERYLEDVSSRPAKNGIVLMHDRPEFNVDDAAYYRGHDNTLELTKRFVAALKPLGYRFASIDEVIGDDRRFRSWSRCGELSVVPGSAPSADRASLRLGNIDGDARGLADVCTKTPSGVLCARNLGNGQFAAASLWMSAESATALGGSSADGREALQLADVDGDGRADLCGRGPKGVTCARARATSDGFDSASLWSTSFSDTDGWGRAPSYYGTVQLADVDGDGFADVCGRKADGIYCAINTRAGAFLPAASWGAKGFSDDDGWREPTYGLTLRFGDINGDHRADVCGRDASGIRCALAGSSGTGFGEPHHWSAGADFSDKDPRTSWRAPEDDASIQLVDIDGDGRADVCAETRTGIVCAASSATSFAPYAPMNYRKNESAFMRRYPDAGGSNAGTSAFGDLNGDHRADVCQQGGRGVMCALTLRGR